MKSEFDGVISVTCNTYAIPIRYTWYNWYNKCNRIDGGFWGCARLCRNCVKEMSSILGDSLNFTENILIAYYVQTAMDVWWAIWTIWEIINPGQLVEIFKFLCDRKKAIIWQMGSMNFWYYFMEVILTRIENLALGSWRKITHYKFLFQLLELWPINENKKKYGHIACQHCLGKQSHRIWLRYGKIHKWF